MIERGVNLRPDVLTSAHLGYALDNGALAAPQSQYGEVLAEAPPLYPYVSRKRKPNEAFLHEGDEVRSTATR